MKNIRDNSFYMKDQIMAEAELKAKKASELAFEKQKSQLKQKSLFEAHQETKAQFDEEKEELENSYRD